MEIKRVTDPNIAEWLIPWYVPSPVDNENQFDIARGVRERLEGDPENTYCSVATEKGIGQAILIAYADKKWVWIWQARTRAGFGESQRMFDTLLEWARSKGYKEVRCGAPNPRIAKVLKRRYKFTEKGRDLVRRIA